MKHVVIAALLILGASDPLAAEPRHEVDFPVNSVFSMEFSQDIVVKNQTILTGAEGMEYAYGSKCKSLPRGHFTIVQNLAGFVIAKYYAPKNDDLGDGECPSTTMTTFSVVDLRDKIRADQQRSNEDTLFRRLQEPIPQWR
jgi:hypothetical protein